MITPELFNLPELTPLQTQFMAGGQMGGMADASQLTPYQFGNFRTMPMPDIYGQVNQGNGFLQDMMIANRGGPFGLPAYTFNTYNPAVDPRLQQAYARRRLADSRMSTVGFGLDLGVGVGLGALGPIGWAASFAYDGLIGNQINQRVQSTRDIQNQTSAKIFTGPQRAGDTGYGFNYQEARNIDKYIRATGADSTLFKEGDLREMMELGLKYGQFDYANTSQQYIQNLKTLQGGFSTFMEVIGSAEFEDVMQDLQRMQNMGAKMSQYQNIARQEQQFQRVLGMTHDQFVNTYGKQGASIYQARGLNAIQGSLTAGNMAAQATYLQRTGAIDPTLMAHMGGVSGVAQAFTEGSAQSQDQFQKILLAGIMKADGSGFEADFDPSKLSDANYLDMIMSRGGTRFGSVEGQRTFRTNASKVMAMVQDRFGTDQLDVGMAMAYGTRMGHTGEDALFYGLQGVQHLSDEQAQARIEALRSGAAFDMRKQAKETASQKAKEEREQRNSWTSKLGRFIDTMSNNFGEGIYKAASFFRGSEERNNALDAGRTYGGYGYSATNDLLAGGTGSSYGESYNGPLDGELGSVIAHFESGSDGASSVSYDKYGGTSYGKFQLSGAKGSMGEWVDEIDKEGGETGKEIARRLRAAAGGKGFDTGSKEGAVVTEYKNLVNQYGDFIEKSQNAYTKKHHYDPALRQLQDPELKAMVEGDRALQEMLWSTVVQHGGAGGRNIFNQSWKKGMTADEFIDAVYKRRETIAQNSSLRDSLVRRYGEEDAELHRYRQALMNGGGQNGMGGRWNTRDATLMGVTSGFVSDMANQYNGRINYSWGGKTLDNSDGKGGIDCSGWVTAATLNMMDQVNANAGYDVYSDAAKAVIRKGGNAQGIIDEVADATGDRRTITRLDQLEANMLIGMDTKARKGIDHIVQTYRDPRTGKLMVTESRGGGVGVITQTAEKWWSDYNMKNIKLTATNVTGLAKSRGDSSLNARKAREATLRNDEKLNEALSTAVNTDWFSADRTTQAQAIAANFDIEQGADFYTKNEASSLKYLNSVVGGENLLSAEGWNDILQENADLLTSSKSQFLGDTTEFQEDAATGKLDYAKMAEGHAGYRIALAVAKKQGLTGEAAEKVAAKLATDPQFMSTIRMGVTGKNYGKNLQARKDEVRADAERVKQQVSQTRAEAQNELIKSTKDMMLGAIEGESSGAAFAEGGEYSKLLNTKEAQEVIDVNGERHIRGAYLEKMPMIGITLGELQSVEEAMKNTEKGSREWQLLEEQRVRLRGNAIGLAKSYGADEGKLAKAIDENSKTDLRNKYVGEAITEATGGKFKLNEEELKSIQGFSERRYKDTSGVYAGDFMNGTDADAAARFDTYVARSKGVEKNLASGGSLASSARNVLQEEHSNNALAQGTIYALGELGVDKRTFENFHNKDVIDDASAQLIVDKLRNANKNELADVFEEARKNGRALETLSVASTLKKEGIDVINSQVGQDEHQRAMADDEREKQAYINSVFAPRGEGNGGITPAANAALEQLPPVMDGLTQAINNLNALIKDKWRN